MVMWCHIVINQFQEINKSILVSCVFITSAWIDIIVKCAMGYLWNSFV